MPVIGHAFVGLASAIAMTPRPGIARRSFLWVPTVVGLSYLPDIVGQLLGMTGANAWHNVAHSLFLSVPIAAVLTPALVAMFRISRARCFCMALVSVALHGILDALYGGKYMLLWPLTAQREGLTVPHDHPVPLEIVIFPAAFGMFYLAWRWRQRASGRQQVPAMWLGSTSKQRWLSIGLTLAILGAAAGTYGLGLLRGYQGKMIDAMCRQKRYEDALCYLDASGRWPSSRPPSRYHCSRGSIYWSMGDRDRAQTEFRMAYEADPSDFWAVFRLAEFYASAPASLERRRRRAAPYVRRLEAEFSGDSDYSGRRSRLLRKLEYAEFPATAGSSD